MKIYVLKFRISGEDCGVALYKTSEEARESARHWLLQLIDCGIEFRTLEEVEQYCHENDIAYIEIECHEI